MPEGPGFRARRHARRRAVADNATVCMVGRFQEMTNALEFVLPECGIDIRLAGPMMREPA